MEEEVDVILYTVLYYISILYTYIQSTVEEEADVISSPLEPPLLSSGNLLGSDSSGNYNILNVHYIISCIMYNIYNMSIYNMYIYIYIIPATSV